MGRFGRPQESEWVPQIGCRIVIRRRFCHNPGLPPPGAMGCRGGGEVLNQHAHREQMNRRTGPIASLCRRKESQMPKIKTKSGAKKRFKITGSGKVLYTQSGKRHGMIKRTKKQIRQLRGTNVLFKADGDNIKKYWLPNG
jgi:large subunit ribosomal protein L35